MQTENMTVMEVAQFLRVSRQTIYNMVRDGKVPHFRVGNKVRFKRADIEALTQPQTKTKPQLDGADDE